MLESMVAAQADALLLLARVLLVALYLLTGWQKITGFGGTVDYMASMKVPFPPLAAAASIVMEFFVGLLLLLGIATQPLALLLFLFTFATALMGHRFWTLQGPARHENQLMFFKNLGLMGGLLLLAVTGPGRFAVG
jgi:putative oxidoreductase